MKSSLRKLRGFALHRHDSKEKREHHPRAHQDELLQASQVVSSFPHSFPSLSLFPFSLVSEFRLVFWNSFSVLGEKE